MTREDTLAATAPDESPSRPLRVAHLSPYYPPHRTGGVGEFVAGLHEGLLAAGHRSIVLTVGTTNSRLGVLAVSAHPLAWFVKAALWARRLRDYDVVHLQGGEAALLHLCLRLMRRRPKIVTTFHVDYGRVAESLRPYRVEGRELGHDLDTRLYRLVVAPLRRLLDALTLRFSDAVNAVCLRSAEDLGLPDSLPQRVIHNGVRDVDDADAHYGPEHTELLYVGSAGHRKRVLILPYVLDRVRRVHPRARLRIVGFEPDGQRPLRDLLSEMDLFDHVEFAGVKRSQELAPFYRASDVLVLPSAYEGLPFVLLEAMRSELPPVATNVGGHPEVIVDGENGFLVDVDDLEQMSARCCTLLADRELRSRLGRRARETVRERFRLDQTLASYLALYRRTIPPTASRSRSADQEGLPALPG